MSTQSTVDVHFTAADRIDQLNEIDNDVTKLLESAGSAINALTGHAAPGSREQPISIEQQKELFTNATSQYFSLLSSIDVRLRRQIYALEEAGIVPAEATLREPQGGLTVPPIVTGLAGAAAITSAIQGAKEKGGVSGGGLGSLDIGWLNSRNDKVGKEMEAELWEKARKLVEQFAKNEPGGRDITDNDLSMDDDTKTLMQPNDSHEIRSELVRE